MICVFSSYLVEIKVSEMFSTYKILCLLFYFSIACIVGVHSFDGVQQNAGTKCLELSTPWWATEYLENESVDAWPWDCLLSQYTEDFLYYMVPRFCIDKRDVSCIRFMENNIEPFSLRKVSLTKVCSWGDLDILKYFIEEKGIHVDKNDPELLIEAASGGNLEVMKYLVYVQNVTKVPPTDIPNALHTAIAINDFEMVRFLVENLNYDVNIVDNHDRTPAHLAAAFNISILKYLIDEKGANLNAKTDMDETLLHYATTSDQPAIVKYLIEEKKMDFDVKDLMENTPLESAVQENHVNVTKYILDERKENIDSTELLRKAVAKADFDVITYMYAESRELLRKNVAKGNLDIITYLVDEKKAKVDIKNDNGQNILLQIAVNSTNLPVIKYLVLDKKVDINCTIDEITCTEIYFLAGKRGDLELVKYLVDEKGININARDNHSNMTVLQYAINYGHLSIVKYLLIEKKVDFNSTDHRSCRYILEQAAVDGDVAIVIYLSEEKKVDITNREPYGLELMKAAATYSSINIINYLWVVKRINIDAFELLDMVQERYTLSNITGYLIDEKKAEIGKIIQSLINFGRLDVIKCLVVDKKVDFDCIANRNNCEELLYEAVSRAHLTLVKCLLDEKNASGDWNVILTSSISSGDLKLLKYLLTWKKGPSINELLHKAAETGNINIINYLINEKKTDIDSTELLRLYLAAVLNDRRARFKLNTIKYLVDEKKADINNVTEHNSWNSVLQHAANRVNLDLIRYLIINKKVNFSGVDYRTRSEVLDLAIEREDLGFIKYLFDQGAVINNTELLETATMKDKLNIVKYLVAERKVKANSTKLLQEFLDNTVYDGKPWYNIDTIRYFVDEMEASINSTKILRQYTLDADDRHYRYDSNIIRYFVDEKGANANFTELLHKYVISASVHPYCDLDFIKYLVDQKKADINGTDMYGNNLLPMVSANPYSNINIFKYLIEEKGADVHSKDSSGQTILHKAAEEENLHLMKYLIEKQKMLPYIDDVDKENRTPISMPRRDILIRKYIAKKKHDAGIA